MIIHNQKVRKEECF